MSRGKAKATLVLEAVCHEIVEERAPVTVRGVAYALFVRGLIDDMEKKNTQKVSRILTAMREFGGLDWHLIVDNSRMIDRANTWDNPASIISAAVNQYRRDYWQDQPEAVEVWSEKATVHGLLKPVLNEFGVTLRTMTGFGSFTTVRGAAEATNLLPEGKSMTVFYIGHHDPSGRYMSDVDLPKRLERYGANRDLSRIAITEQDFHLPKFQAATKNKDSRYKWFVSQFGYDCWELDAMNPNDLRARVREQIASCLDLPKWEHAKRIEQVEIASMQEFQSTIRDMRNGVRR